MMVRTVVTLTIILVAATTATSAAQINEKWSVSFTERFRLVTWDNAITLDETADGSQAFTRHRTQVGAVWTPAPVVSFGFQLANEFRYYAEPSDRDFNLNETFVDQLYLKINRPWNAPLTLTIGRQNIMLGEGFVVMDGHPLDGSRSIYFNAVRADWNITDFHRLTGFVSHKEETDDYLPVINNQDQALVEQPETGAGLYYAAAWPTREQEFYFIYKEYSKNDAFPIEASTRTVGGRMLWRFLDERNLLTVAEVAIQGGKRDTVDRQAVGIHGYVRYEPEWEESAFYLPRALTIGLIGLSGDNPYTDKLEDWDPVFSRWPKWSESYIYTQILEDGVAQWNNLGSFYTVLDFNLTTHVGFRFDYFRLNALQEDTSSTGFPGGEGKVRGDLFIGKLTFAFDEHWTGHLLWEGFTPGDYYFEGADSYAWIRAELMFRY